MKHKTDIQELNIPKDDIECWLRYPKYHWVYDLSRLLDTQNIEWSPFEINSLSDKQINNILQTNPGYIYIDKPQGRYTITEVFISKGEIKYMRHIDTLTGRELPSLFGEIELMLNAFVTLHFQKFTGVITTEMISTEIYRIYLKPYLDINLETNQEVIKLMKRIYKKNDIIVDIKSRDVITSI